MYINISANCVRWFLLFASFFVGYSDNPNFILDCAMDVILLSDEANQLYNECAHPCKKFSFLVECCWMRLGLTVPYFSWDVRKDSELRWVKFSELFCHFPLVLRLVIVSAPWANLSVEIWTAVCLLTFLYRRYGYLKPCTIIFTPLLTS